MLREGRLKDKEEFQILGENLYKILFDNSIGGAVKEAFGQPLQFMRVELENFECPSFKFCERRKRELKISAQRVLTGFTG